MFKVPICLSKHPANSSARWTECITDVSECSIKKWEFREFRMDNSEWTGYRQGVSMEHKICHYIFSTKVYTILYGWW